MNLLTQTNFAIEVKVPRSRISLLIKQDRLKTHSIDGVIFVVDNKANRDACKSFMKRGPKTKAR